MNAPNPPFSRAASFLLPYTSDHPSNGPRLPVRATIGLRGEYVVVVLASTQGFTGPGSQSIAMVIEDIARALFEAFQTGRLARGDSEEQQAHAWLLQHWKDQPECASLSALFNPADTPGVVLVEHNFPSYVTLRRHSFMQNTFSEHDHPRYHRSVYGNQAVEAFGEAVTASLVWAKDLDFSFNP